MHEPLNGIQWEIEMKAENLSPTFQMFMPGEVAKKLHLRSNMYPKVFAQLCGGTYFFFNFTRPISEGDPWRCAEKNWKYIVESTDIAEGDKIGFHLKRHEFGTVEFIICSKRFHLEENLMKVSDVVNEGEDMEISVDDYEDEGSSADEEKVKIVKDEQKVNDDEGMEISGDDEEDEGRSDNDEKDKFVKDEQKVIIVKD